MSLGQDVKELFATITAMFGNRAELFGLELAEERQRLINAVILAVVVAILLTFFLLGLSFLGLMWLWDTPYRYSVVGGVTVLYGVLALVCIAKLKGLFSKNIPFASSIQVLRDDVAKLEGEILSGSSSASNRSSGDTQSRTKEV
jgi:uncharacterized membrane protein YqjE